MRVFVLFVLGMITVMAADAPKVITLTESEQLSIVRAHEAVLQLQGTMRQVDDYYKTLAAQEDQLLKAYDKAVEAVRAAHKCDKCSLNADRTQLTPPQKDEPKK
ncbi:MAG: hypothetical protein KGL39_22125 [Patescibacteria group bacterium]|nr:hypothetical protein [Patescibacteria group bacterium]